MENRDIIEQIISNALSECEKAMLTVGEIRRLPKLMEIRIEEQLEISQGYIDLHIPRQEYLDFCKYKDRSSSHNHWDSNGYCNKYDMSMTDPCGR